MPGPLDSVTRAQFETYRIVKTGASNPERMDNPYWTALVLSGLSAYAAAAHFGIDPMAPIFPWNKPKPMWTFDRSGMSRTLLADDTIVFIGGEHEDFYDPDFKIYNDVILRRWDGTVEIYGYPVREFEPTDFHSATQVDDSIFIIGGIGYPENRVIGTTPVYELDLRSMRIEPLNAPGSEPGWIHRHNAIYWSEENAILIWGGKVATSKNTFVDNEEMWAFSLGPRTWRKLESVTLGVLPCR